MYDEKHLQAKIVSAFTIFTDVWVELMNVLAKQLCILLVSQILATFLASSVQHLSYRGVCVFSIAFVNSCKNCVFSLNEVVYRPPDCSFQEIFLITNAYIIETTETYPFQCMCFIYYGKKNGQCHYCTFLNKWFFFP